MITLIAAAGQQNELGKNNDLIWQLPDDFKRFKKLTTGHYIIMGRKTFESFPKPLPNRIHIIITRDTHYTPKIAADKKQDVIVVHSLAEAIEKANSQNEIFIIGGGQIYTQAISIAQKIELTRVHGTFDADTYFPEIDTNLWKKVFDEYHPADEKHKYDFTYETWVKN